MPHLRQSIIEFGRVFNLSFVAAILLIVIGGWSIWRTHDAALASASDDARNLARSLSQHAARTVEELDILIAGAVERIEEEGTNSQLRHFLTRHAIEAAQLRNLMVTNERGQCVADTLPPHGPLSVASQSDFTWQRDHNDGKLYVGDIASSVYDRTSIIPISRRISRSDGSFGGVVRASLSPDALLRFYATVHIGESGSVALYKDSGNVLVRYPADPHTQLDPARVSQNAKFFQAPSGLSRATSVIDGVERLYAFEHVDGYPLVVAAGIAVSDALAGWRRSALIDALVLTLTSGLLVALGIRLELHRRQNGAIQSVSHEVDRQYRLLAENSSDLIILRHALDGDCTYVSPSSVTTVGWDPDELARLPSETYYHPDDLERVAREFNGLTAENPHLVSLHRIRHKAGHYIWVEAVLQLTGADTAYRSVVIAARDVTARQVAQLALRESEQRYRILADTSSDIILLFDLGLKGRYVSPACRIILGYEPQEMLDISLSEAIHPDDLPALRDLFERLAAGTIEGDRAVMTYRARHKLGQWVWIESGVNLVRDAASGAPTSLICSWRDVSERQLLAEHLEHAKETAEQATSMKAEFLANMSHELRTPLTGILGVHDLLHSDAKLTDSQRRLVGLANASGRSLLRIVNDILDFSKIEAGQLAIETIPFDLRNLIETCRDLTSETLKRKPIRITTRLVLHEVEWFVGDPVRLQQLLLNILMNAAKFTEQGEIAIDVIYVPETASLKVAVTDTGIGIAADKLPTLFERFSQADASTSRRYGGTGLGLAICRRLAELMGGHIGVDSVEGQGSRFWFDLPIEPHANAREPAPTFARRQERLTSLHILLAEDNIVNQEIISAILAEQKHRVTVVGDGAAAVDAVSSEHDFDVILMDVQMPGMDGLAATSRIRHVERGRSLVRTPIIGLTANAMIGDAERCFAAGMDGHVPKPIDWANLFNVIDETLAARTKPAAQSRPKLEPTGDVIDNATLQMLERVIGREKLRELLLAFVTDVDQRVADLEDLTVKELGARTHMLTSMAGQLGFSELSRVCAEIEDDSRQGGGLTRIDELRVTAARASEAARASQFAVAA